MRFRGVPLAVIALGLFFTLPAAVHAVGIPYWGPIVPSQDATCAASWQGFVLLINQTIAFLITIGITFVAPLSIAYAGALFVLNPVNASGKEQAKTILWNTIIGLVIMLAAYLIVDGVLTALTTKGGVAAWTNAVFTTSSNPCLAVATVLSQAAPVSGTGAVGTSSGPGGDCPGNLICTSGKCQADPQLDNGTGAAGQACQPANPNCVSPLICDSTDTCSTPPDNTASSIPSSCSGGTASGTNAGTDTLNVQAAVNWLTTNVTATVDTEHACLSDIQKAFSAGGVTLSCPSGYAGQCNSSLQSLGFTSLGSSDASPQVGDVAVIQHINPPPTSNTIGHITMFTGSAWISDFVQSSSESPPGNPYAANQFGGAQYWRP